MADHHELPFSDALSQDLVSSEHMSNLFVDGLCVTEGSSSMNKGEFDFESTADVAMEMTDDSNDDSNPHPGNNDLRIVTGTFNDEDYHEDKLTKTQDHDDDADVDDDDDAHSYSQSLTAVGDVSVACGSSNFLLHEKQQVCFSGITQSCAFTPAGQPISPTVPTYSLNNRVIVILPDIYKVIRDLCGSCSTLRGQINKLGILTARFQPLHMTRMKQIGAVSLEAKCCSYILLSEFKRVLEKYKAENIIPHPELMTFVSAIDISVPMLSRGGLGDEKFPLDDSLPLPSTKPLAMATDSVHTFMIKDQVVICTVELQRIFEALFGQSVSMSLVKLGVLQKRFSPLQLDEVMDFVDIDEKNQQNAFFYISKKDAERVFQYAEALAGVENIMVRWLEPLHLSEEGSPQHGIDSRIQGRGTSLEKTTVHAASEIPFTPGQELAKKEMANEVDAEFDSKESLEDTDEDLLPGDYDKDNKASLVLNDPEEESLFTVNLDLPTTHEELINKSPTACPKAPVPLNPSLAHQQEPCSSGTTDINMSEPTSQAASHPTLEQANSSLLMKPQSSPSSSASEVSLSADPCEPHIIRTYLIEGREVVCIPDIHKIVIQLYGQSVQVGYYLQRLQIVTQRFSTLQVKRLKALTALNSKATLCTFINKPDAIRLLKMYDVFNTDSKLQLIQWAEPVPLEGIDPQFICKEEIPPPTADMGTEPEGDPIDPVKIATFLINGEVVVSVPDAHKVVQVLNGQSVQVRYNMDKLGIRKRKYSYSQVYQLRAVSDLKRPSMCTFITKADADKLLMHYLTPENASRLNYIQWLQPLKLTDLNPPEPATGSPSSAVDPDQDSSAHVKEDTNNENLLSDQPPAILTSVDFTDDRPSMVVRSIQPNTSEVQSNISDGSGLSGLRPSSTEHQLSSDAEYDPLQPSRMVTMATRSEVQSSTQAVSAIEARRGKYSEQGLRGQKRAAEEAFGKETLDCELKRVKAEKDEIAATLERKETEMKILHDAYQQQAAHEREKRRHAEQETAELRASNEELMKNLQRKESEMKILHDSYQFQIRKERENREEMENELTELKGSVAFASGVSYGSHIKKERL